MRSPPARLAVPFVLLAACGSNQTRPASEPTVSTAASGPASSDAATTSTAAATANAAAAEPERAPADPCERVARESFRPRSSGTSGDEQAEMDSYEGTWALTHFDARGAKATLVPVLGDDGLLHEGASGDVNYAAVVGDYALDVAEPTVADYDGDGAPEVMQLDDSSCRAQNGMAMRWAETDPPVTLAAPAAAPAARGRRVPRARH